MNTVLREIVLPSGQTFQVVQGDITVEAVDAIVNAANANLQHGGGVAGVIARKGGSAIQQESDAWVRRHGPVRHTKPAWTTAGELPCRYVIHAVGPVWGEGHDDEKLAQAVAGSLRTAEELGLKSIAMPAISTGIFGFPKERAAGVIFTSIETYFLGNPDSALQLVRVTLFDQPTIEVFTRAWEALRQS